MNRPGASALVRRFGAEEWRKYREIRLRALADAPEAFGSTLARERGCTDEEWAARLASSANKNLPLVAELEGTPVGLAWGRIEDAPDVAHVYQMWVAPEFRRKGIGEMLLTAIVDWARSAGVRCLVLSVAPGNDAARRLYRRAGFVPVGEPDQALDGSTLVAREMRLLLA